MTELKRLKVKICLVGEAATGKSELIRRFVDPNFDDRYINTLGTKVSKRTMPVSLADGSQVDVDLTVWDIMGHKGFRELLKEAYFYGAKGVLAVCDVARRQTLQDLHDWIEGVFEVAGRLPVAILVNETGKGGTPQVTEADVQQVAEAYDAPFYFTSSVTGANVEAAFQGLAQRIAKERFSARTDADETIRGGRASGEA